MVALQITSVIETKKIAHRLQTTHEKIPGVGIAIIINSHQQEASPTNTQQKMTTSAKQHKKTRRHQAPKAHRQAQLYHSLQWPAVASGNFRLEPGTDTIQGERPQPRRKSDYNEEEHKQQTRQNNTHHQPQKTPQAHRNTQCKPLTTVVCEFLW